ncbi:aldo/keto reductase [Paenibacillus sp. NFR01]|uniref:aldo/keto reductase n=1 Tax=Paenibacillus sp. NFR01 TaxID=1566279 RepID=UPI0008CF45F0|nr:aldo/keto reductase [Paenibacillus sp. NFR01]SET90500.1 Aldo/keto reductase [Paenibacillus sp. NFR01]
MSNYPAPQITLRDGTALPKIGLGTWFMGEKGADRAEEIAALRLGVDMGLKVIDTAEMYGNGQSEELVGEAVRGIRDDVFLVSKVLPQHAGRNVLAQSCEQSLKRLGTDHLDLYLLHWRGDVPLEETVRGMEELVASGKILRWGVSNFDLDDMKELYEVQGGDRCATNQVLYHLGSRGIEHDLLPWQAGNRVPVMAYSPLAQGGMLRKGMIESGTVREIARRHEATPLQILLAWSIRDHEVLAIPKASSRKHVAENAAAAQIRLRPDELWMLDEAFPQPAWRVPLDMI